MLPELVAEVESKYAFSEHRWIGGGPMTACGESNDDRESGVRADLDAIGEARSAALASTKRPTWLYLATCLPMGAAFGFGMLGGTLGWSLFWVLLAIMVVPTIIDARRVRRRGRIIDERSVGWQFLWILSISIVFAAMRWIPISSQLQPWAALAAGIFVAGLVYSFLRWDEALMSRRLLKGDFDPYTLF